MVCVKGSDRVTPEEKREGHLKREYHTYCCKMLHAIESDPGKYKVMGFKQWVEQREEPERVSGDK